MIQNGTSFNVVITPPSLEYTVESENYTIIKYLDLVDCHKFLSSLFVDWHLTALSILTSTKNFEEQIFDIESLVQNRASNRSISSREVQVPSGIRNRNFRLTANLEKKLIKEAKEGHSLVPG